MLQRGIYACVFGFDLEILLWVILYTGKFWGMDGIFFIVHYFHFLSMNSRFLFSLLVVLYAWYVLLFHFLKLHFFSLQKYHLYSPFLLLPLYTFFFFNSRIQCNFFPQNTFTFLTSFLPYIITSCPQFRPLFRTNPTKE